MAEKVRCSFCGSGESKKLIASKKEKAAICDECSLLSLKTLLDEPSDDLFNECSIELLVYLQLPDKLSCLAELLRRSAKKAIQEEKDRLAELEGKLV